MARANALKAMDPVWFRFTDEDDKGKYGSQWILYDEPALLRKRARDLIEIEDAIGVPVVGAINSFRNKGTLGDLALTWIALHQVDPARAGGFDEYNPLTHMIEWTTVDPSPGKDEGPQDPALTSESMNSAPTDTVVLPTMPISE